MTVVTARGRSWQPNNYSAKLEICGINDCAFGCFTSHQGNNTLSRPYYQFKIISFLVLVQSGNAQGSFLVGSGNHLRCLGINPGLFNSKQTSYHCAIAPALHFLSFCTLNSLLHSTWQYESPEAAYSSYWWMLPCTGDAMVEKRGEREHWS